MKALEKAKEAIQRVIDRSIGECRFNNVYDLEEALAALEAVKPSENAIKVAIRVSLENDARAIEQYAEAYHQRKLAEGK